MRPGVLILAGPTASGKTRLAIALAKRFDAEIVGADSRQIYRDMPIGTAAPSAHEAAGVRHHLVGFLDPARRYSAAAFVEDALAAVDDISARGKRTIVVGGTGFYIRALSGDVALAGEWDDSLRVRLAREAALHPPDVLHAWLAALDPARAAALPASDGYRVMRALEFALATRSGKAQPGRKPHETLRSRGIAFMKVVLDVEMAELERRITRRVDRMLDDGLLDEAERLGETAIAADAVGYPQALAYLRGFSTLPELRAQLIRATRRYAKRQMTWFRSEPNLTHVDDANAFDRLAAIAASLPGWSIGEFPPQA